MQSIYTDYGTPHNGTVLMLFPPDVVNAYLIHSTTMQAFISIATNIANKMTGGRMGLLRIRGTIDLTQFWPSGQSDADTTKIVLSISNDSFAFAADGLNFKPTHVYDNAMVHGTVRKAVITKGALSTFVFPFCAKNKKGYRTSLPIK